MSRFALLALFDVVAPQLFMQQSCSIALRVIKQTCCKPIKRFQSEETRRHLLPQIKCIPLPSINLRGLTLL